MNPRHVAILQRQAFRVGGRDPVQRERDPGERDVVERRGRRLAALGEGAVAPADERVLDLDADGATAIALRVDARNLDGAPVERPCGSGGTAKA